MTKEREIAYIALMAALIVVLRFIPAIQLGAGVPITAQSLGIMLAGTILGAWRGFLAVAIVVALGLLGLPVFASGAAGIGILSSPTVGFILGFPIAAACTGWLTTKLKAQTTFMAAFAGCVFGAIFVLYALGVIGLVIVTQMGMGAAILAMLPFIGWDLVKAVIASAITAALAQSRPEFVLTRGASVPKHKIYS